MYRMSHSHITLLLVFDHDILLWYSTMVFYYGILLWYSTILFYSAWFANMAYHCCMLYDYYYSLWQLIHAVDLDVNAFYSDLIYAY